MVRTGPGDVGVYVHWPFCQAKCPYCDFNSHVRDGVDTTAWSQAFISEIDRISDELGPRRIVSVFFGGGTPSLMPDRLVASILNRLSACWNLAGNAEVTLEANPTSVEAARFAGYRGAGVNRVSVGVQALRDDDLRRLGRLHSVSEALNALDVARGTFDRVNMDLIYARQDQTPEAWAEELSEALSLGLDHYALYQLTIEPGTAFGRLHDAGRLGGLPSEDLSADMFELTQRLCDAAGRPAYEVSNHARPGSESAHNLIYWRGGDYVGLGPGAHGRISLGPDRFATDTLQMPEDWLAAARVGKTESREKLSARDMATERMLMGLRLSEGMDLPGLRALAPDMPDAAGLAHLVDLGLVEQQGDRLLTTSAGRLLLNSVVEALLPNDFNSSRKGVG